MNKKWLKIALGILCAFLIYRMFFYEKPIPEHCRQARRVTHAFITDMCKKHGLVYAVRGGCFIDDVKEISVSFDKADKSDIPESRILLVNCVEEFLRRINADEDVRPFLVQYPFTNENVNISIGFIEPKEDADLQNIVHAFNVKGEAVYSIYDKPHDRYKPTFEEPYEEALKIVKESGRLDVDMSDERAAS